MCRRAAFGPHRALSVLLPACRHRAVSSSDLALYTSRRPSGDSARRVFGTPPSTAGAHRIPGGRLMNAGTVGGTAVFGGVAEVDVAGGMSVRGRFGGAVQYQRKGLAP